MTSAAQLPCGCSAALHATSTASMNSACLMRDNTRHLRPKCPTTMPTMQFQSPRAKLPTFNQLAELCALSTRPPASLPDQSGMLQTLQATLITYNRPAWLVLAGHEAFPGNFQSLMAQWSIVGASDSRYRLSCKHPHNTFNQPLTRSYGRR